MTTINVQFSDGTDETVISYFGAPQNPDVYQNLGTLLTSDARWASFYNALPASMQRVLPSPSS